MKDATLTRALEAEKMFLSSKEARYIYDLREKAKRDLFSSIATAEERGEERGIRKVAIKMLKNKNLSLEDIAENTGISIAELKDMKLTL